MEGKKIKTRSPVIRTIDYGPWHWTYGRASLVHWYEMLFFVARPVGRMAFDWRVFWGVPVGTCMDGSSAGMDSRKVWLASSPFLGLGLGYCNNYSSSTHKFLSSVVSTV